MLTLLERPADQRKPSAPPVVDGPYLCETVAQFGTGPTTALLDHEDVRTNALAVWWLQIRAGQLLDQMAPAFAAPVVAWLADEAEQDHVRRTLALRLPYTLPVHAGDVEYRLTIKAGPGKTPRRVLQAVTG